jgi:small basic protein
MYIGIVIGTIVCPILFNFMSPKVLIAISACLNGAFATVIAIPNTSYVLIFASRIVVGLFLVSTIFTEILSGYFLNYYLQHN